MALAVVGLATIIMFGIVALMAVVEIQHLRMRPELVLTAILTTLLVQVPTATPSQLTTLALIQPTIISSLIWRFIIGKGQLKRCVSTHISLDKAAGCYVRFRYRYC